MYQLLINTSVYAYHYLFIASVKFIRFFKSWGFSLEAIPTLVYLWQGEADKNVPLKHGQYLAWHIPNCVARFPPEVGHLMPESYLDEIFHVFVDAN